jgi:hypothetical protein
MNSRATFFFPRASKDPIANRGKIRAPGNFVTEFSAYFRHEFPLRGKQTEHFAILFGHACDNHIGVSRDFHQL